MKIALNLFAANLLTAIAIFFLWPSIMSGVNQDVMVFQPTSSYSPSVVLGVVPSGKESVRDELIRRQTEAGLAIAWYDYNGPEIVNFRKRTILQGKSLIGQFPGDGIISRDGTQIAFQLRTSTSVSAMAIGIMKPDNSDLRLFWNVEMPGLFCWSNDMTHLAVVTAIKNSPETDLKILDLQSKYVRDISPANRTTSQCWSPDDREIVFARDGNVMIQDIEATKARVLAVGSTPTWSPDGNWIAYQDEHTHKYYVIHPSGEGKKELFHSRNGMAGLYWSPDSRMVAYVVEGGGLLFLDAEFYRLRVRRLEDNSDDWVADGVNCCRDIQWVTNKDLLERIESQAARK